MVLKINKETHHNELELLFTLPEEHSKGVGLAAWAVGLLWFVGAAVGGYASVR